MKCFAIIIISVVLFGTTLSAQLYEGQPLMFDQVPRCMYYDSLTELSYISGSFRMVNDDTANIAIYDGSTFSLMPNAPIPSFRGGVVNYKGKLYAGGGYGLAVWDGSSWSVVDEEVGILNLKVVDGKLYVMGYIDSIAGVPCSGVAVWNDTVWSSLPGLSDIITTGLSNSISDLAFYKGNIYVTGEFFNPDYPTIQDMMMYDGSNWQAVGSFNGSGLGGGYKLLTWRDTLYVAGMFLESEGNPGNNIAAWDGTQWHRLQEGLNGVTGGSGGSSVNDIRVYNNELWATGYFQVINGRYAGENYGGLAKWNGAEWCTMNSWKIQQILNMGTWKDELFIMGNFWYLDHDSSVNVIAKWVGGDYTDTCLGLGATGIEERESRELTFTVYPNPASDVFTVSFVNDGSIKTGAILKLTCTDMLGRVLSETEWRATSGTNRFQIDASGMASGTYFISLSGEERKSTGKVIKL